MARKCPLCGKEAEEKFTPFCSRLCANKDMLKWMNGHYAVPVKDGEPDEDIDGEAPRIAET